MQQNSGSDQHTPLSILFLISALLVYLALCPARSNAQAQNPYPASSANQKQIDQIEKDLQSLTDEVHITESLLAGLIASGDELSCDDLKALQEFYYGISASLAEIRWTLTHLRESIINSQSWNFRHVKPIRVSLLELGLMEIGLIEDPRDTPHEIDLLAAQRSKVSNLLVESGSLKRHVEEMITLITRAQLKACNKKKRSW